MNQFSLLTGPADAWLVALVDTSLRLSVILLVAGAIATVLRRSSANLRHLVWALALAGALMLPLGASYLPALSLPVPRPLLAFARGAADAPGAGRLSEAPMPAESPRGRRVGVVVEDVEDADLTAGSAGVMTQTVAPAVSDVARPPVVVPMPPEPGADQPAPSRTGVVRSWPQLVVGFWIVGVVVLLLRIGLGMVATQRLGRRATSPRDGEWEDWPTSWAVGSG